MFDRTGLYGGLGARGWVNLMVIFQIQLLTVDLLLEIMVRALLLQMPRRST